MIQNHSKDDEFAPEISRRDFIKSVLIFCAAGGLGFNSSGCSRYRSVRFGIVTDVHYADRPPAGTRFYRDSVAKMKEAVDLMNQKQPDFLIELGDFKDQDLEPAEENTIAYLRTIEGELRKFNGPTYHVLGNHDMDSLSKEQFLQHVTNTNIRSDSSYYSFDLKGFHFVVLDANFMTDGEPYNRDNYDWTDANIPGQELKWLSHDLADCSRPAIIFVHQLLDGIGPHYIKNASQVREVLEQSRCVLAVFQGHQHRGQYNCINEIHYVTMQAMVEGEGLENNNYTIVEVTPNFNIHMTGFRKEKSRDLRVSNFKRHEEMKYDEKTT